MPSARPPSVEIRFYSVAREAVGAARLHRPVPASGATIGALLTALAVEFPRLRTVLPRCRIALNGTYTDGTAVPVRPGDALAVHPPYSGG